MSDFISLFGWPSGSVLTNLIASLLWAPLAGGLAYWRAKVHLRRLHARHDAHEAQLADLHAKVDAIHANQQRAPIGVLDDGTPVHIDGAKLFREVERQAIRFRRRNPGTGGL